MPTMTDLCYGFNVSLITKSLIFGEDSLTTNFPPAFMHFVTFLPFFPYQVSSKSAITYIIIILIIQIHGK
jgi:hypothetical protein